MSVDINSLDFVQTFDVSKATVGIVGHGYVGQAVSHFFRKKPCTVLVYDKNKPELGSITDVVGRSEVIFVAVPTPMREDGSCHTGIVESVLDDIVNKARALSRSLDSFVVVVKSTVPPGFTESMQLTHDGLRLVFSPEFLTEANSVADFENQNRIIVGGEEEDALVVSKYFESIIPEKVRDDQVLILQCEPATAEMVKLYANGMLMAKVLFSNEVYLICQTLGIDYDDVRQLACLDERIGIGHTRVPGPDGHLGAGGHCFPKDINNLRHVARVLKTGERLFTAIIERNDEIRKDKDWERMEGRAVIKG